MRKLNVNTAMPRPINKIPQAKRVAPPAIPISLDVQQQQQQQHRHSTGSTGMTSTGSGGLSPPSTPPILLSSSVGYSAISIEDGGFTQSRDSPVALTIKDDSNTDFNVVNQQQTINLQSTQQTSQTQVGQQILTHKAAVYYHQQLALQEDQGIDLTQSPGRDSPGSSSGSAGSGSRHSTASLDSGRASSYITGSSGGCGGSNSIGGSGISGGCGSNNISSNGPGNGCGGGGIININGGNTNSSLRGCSIISGGTNSIGSGCSINGSSSTTSGGGCSGGSGQLSSPRCSSVSSCSIGSVDRISQRSLNNDNDLIIDWLIDIKYDEYAQLFIQAGYDMPTICRMTPEDLTAIGIKNPQHRERLKQYIDDLQLPDCLPNFVPGSIEEWLRLLRLDEYIQPLLEQNYKTVHDVTQLTWEDLEDIGIVKLGHQKKILLAIKRVKDIINGKLINHHHQKCFPINQDHQQIQQQPPMQRMSWGDEEILSTGFQQSSPSSMIYDCDGIIHENNDFVIIKIRQPRGKSLESLEDINECNVHNRTHLTFSHYSTDSSSLSSQSSTTSSSSSAAAAAAYYYHHNQHHNNYSLPQQQQQQQQYQQPHHLHQQQLIMNKTICMNNSSLPYHIGNLTWRRSYDDGDITPTNEITIDLNDTQGGGTLPRQRTSNNSTNRQQQRLIDRSIINSTVCGVGCGGGHSISPTSSSKCLIQQQQQHSIGGCTTISIPLQSDYQRFNSNQQQQNNSTIICSPLVNKKQAPEPPRRQCSIRNTLGGTTTTTTIQTNSPTIQDCNIVGPGNGGGGGIGVIYSSGDVINNCNIDDCGDISNCCDPTTQQQINCNNTQNIRKYLHYNQQQQQQYIPSQQLQQQHFQQQKQPIYVNYCIQTHQTTAEIHCDKTHDNKSNSSIDSIDTIPFANENTGTIKQRFTINHQDITTGSTSLTTSPTGSGPSSLLSSSISPLITSSSSAAVIETNLGQHYHNPHHLHLHHNITRSNDMADGVCGGGIDNLIINDDDDNTIAGVSIVPGTSSLSSYHSCCSRNDDNDLINNSNCCNNITQNSVSKNNNNNNDSTNVLNDIGNMLANLTDELDAMLEEEKRVGINDSE